MGRLLRSYAGTVGRHSELHYTCARVRQRIANLPVVTGTIGAAGQGVPIKGRTYLLKKTDGTTNTVSCIMSGSDKIDGVAGLSLTTQYAHAKLSCSDVAGQWDRKDN